jgi:hypothetical protein
VPSDTFQLYFDVLGPASPVFEMTFKGSHDVIPWRTLPAEPNQQVKGALFVKRMNSEDLIDCPEAALNISFPFHSLFAFA